MFTLFEMQKVIPDNSDSHYFSPYFVCGYITGVGCGLMSRVTSRVRHQGFHLRVKCRWLENHQANKQRSMADSLFQNLNRLLENMQLRHLILDWKYTCQFNSHEI